MWPMHIPTWLTVISFQNWPNETHSIHRAHVYQNLWDVLILWNACHQSWDIFFWNRTSYVTFGSPWEHPLQNNVYDLRVEFWFVTIIYKKLLLQCISTMVHKSDWLCFKISHKAFIMDWQNLDSSKCIQWLYMDKCSGSTSTTHQIFCYHGAMNIVAADVYCVWCDTSCETKECVSILEIICDIKKRQFEWCKWLSSGRAIGQLLRNYPW